MLSGGLTLLGAFLAEFRGWLALVTLTWVCIAPRAEACATVDHDPAALATGVTAERAIIVYDPSTKTEHFIRSATFLTKGSSDFGFIVPTPAPPTFGEVDQSVFGALADSYDAARPVKKQLHLTSVLAFTLKADRSAREPSLVQELGTAHVAGMDVTVVKADDVAALEEWLSSHGFTKRPALTAWLEHYVQRGFVFSAFRYAATGVTVTSKAARISFTTEVPLYPYLEPADSLPRSSALDVWFIGPERREWQDEATASDPPSVWLASSKVAIPDELSRLSGTSKPWVTLFHDERSTRPRGDVRFPVSKTAVELAPSPKLEPIEVPLEGLFCLMTIALLGGAFLFRRRRG